LAFAAEELGYASVWTFDSPARERWIEPIPGLIAAGVLDTLAMLVSVTSRISVGAALLRTRWPLPDPVTERLRALVDSASGRLMVARPFGSGDGDAVGRLLQMWSPDAPGLAPWAEGLMVERWAYGVRPAPPDVGVGQLVVRLPVDDRVERAVSEVARLRTIGAEIVLDVAADTGVDHALDLYSRVAEGVADQADHSSPERAGPRCS
jgi:hypothetical protein